jgi:hypothetical protein
MALAAVALVLVAAAAACSDAHSQQEKDLSNPGVDPQTVTVLAPPDMAALIDALGQAFGTTHPGVSVVQLDPVTARPQRTGMTVVVRDDGLTAIKGGATVSLWITRLALLSQFRKDPRAVGAPQLFGTDHLALVVRGRNGLGISSLAVFGPGLHPKTGMCAPTLPCGRSGDLWLKAANVEAKPDLRFPTNAALEAALVSSKVKAGLLFSSQVADNNKLTIVPIPSPPAPTVVYGTLRMDPNPTGQTFQTWLATSPEAHYLLGLYGVSAPPGGQK